jgi:hypothetical protein
LLGSLAFQLFFFWAVVWQDLRGLLRRQLGNIFGYWVHGWAWIRGLHWDWTRNWTWGWGRWSIVWPWKIGYTASSFRRLG